MHENLIKNISDGHAKAYLVKMIDKIKDENVHLYDEIEDDLYYDLYGCHFTDFTLEEALKNMVNEDGSHGAHWSLEQTSDVARRYNVDENLYDWCYVMNMIYSDYYGAIPDELNYYVKLSQKFINDKDAGKSKPYTYYKTMKKL